MSRRTRVVGFIPPGDDWSRKVAALRACRTAEVEPPSGLEEWLGLDEGEGQEPSEHGREVDLTSYQGDHVAVSKYRAEMRDGYDIDISKLPPEIKVIRVYTSY